MKMKKILIVEDEIKLLYILKKSFEQNGYMVRTAETAEDALEIVKHEEFKVMFLDLGLPGMNGLNLCREIRKDRPQAHIFAVTGMVSDYEFSNCFNAGFDGYFRKPMSWKLLYQTAEEVFNPEKIANPRLSCARHLGNPASIKL